MIFDRQNRFSWEQAETTIAAHASTDYLDTQVTGDAIDQLRFWLQVATTCTSGGSATVQFILESADDSAFSANLTTELDSGAIAVATLVQGYKPFGSNVRLPSGMRRYIRVKYTIAVAVLTAGAFSAGFTGDTQSDV